MPVRYQYTSHETFSHDSIDSLGYDWERIAQPGIAPRFVLIYTWYLPGRAPLRVDEYSSE